MPSLVLQVPTNAPDSEKPWVIDQWCKDNLAGANECSVVIDIPADAFHCVFRFANEADAEKCAAQWGKFVKA